MALDDIKSPLPPRRFSSLYEPEVEAEPINNEKLKINNEEKTEGVKREPEIKPPQPMVSNQLPVNKGKLWIYLVIGLLVAAILFLVFKVIVPGLKSKTGGQITLTYWGLWEEPATIQGLIDEYESKNPNVKINYVRNQKVNYRTRLNTRLVSNDSSEPAPDIFRIHSSWLPMFAGNLAKVPTQTATTVGLDTDFFDSYKNTIKVNGSWMGIPLMYDGLALFYNKDLIESAGVNLPKSWWDLEMAANKLTVRDANGKITVAGVGLGLVDNVDHWSDIVGLMLKQGGVDILNPDAENTKKMQDVLTFYTLFRSKDHVWDEAQPSTTELFANGKLAFYFAPSWRVFNIEDMKIPSLKYDITTVPQLPTLQDVPLDQINSDANLTNIHWSTYWVESVNSKSKNQAEAWKFLEFLATKDSLEKMYTGASQIRAFGEIYPRKSMADKMASNNFTKSFVKAANDSTNWYLSSRTFDEGLNDEMSKYFGDAINAIVVKNIPAETVMPDLRNGINQMIQKYSLK